MRLKTSVVAGLLLLAGAGARVGAAPFVNLDFEQATVPPGTATTIAASAAFPGWTPRIGTFVLSDVYYNYPGIGEASVVIYDQPLSIGGLPVLEGRFSVTLISGTDSDLESSLSQQGDIPAGMRSLRFLGPPRPSAVIAVNGTVLELVSLPNPGSSLPLWGADITAFAGSNVDLRLSSVHPPMGNVAGIDSLRFSTQPIPEPSQAALLACMMAIWSFGRRANSR
jgi:hypothetical protein